MLKNERKDYRKLIWIINHKVSAIKAWRFGLNYHYPTVLKLKISSLKRKHQEYVEKASHHHVPIISWINPTAECQRIFKLDYQEENLTNIVMNYSNDAQKLWILQMPGTSTINQ